MSSEFEKDFETILEDILADTVTKFPGADVSQGSPLFMLAARLASVSWGLYKKQAKLTDQIFPDTAETLLVDRHAYCKGLTRTAGESNADLALRILAKIQMPPAGGNDDDYETWAKEVDGVADAHCIPTPTGPGTVAVVLLGKDGDEAPVPSDELVIAVTQYIEAKRPVTAGDFSVLPVQVLKPAIIMNISGNVNIPALAASIQAYCAKLKTKDTLVLSQLESLALQLGADDATVTTPAANVMATNYQVIRAGDITINV